MALVTGKNLARSYGDHDIFDEVSVSIPHGARIALVGPNGSGKTSLLRILVKLDEPSAGTVTHARTLRIGFLPQEAQLLLSGERSLWSEMLSAFEDVLAQEAKLGQLAEAMAAQPNQPEVIQSWRSAGSF
jgi:ATP-binding cassette subfamily F protein 3